MPQINVQWYHDWVEKEVSALDGRVAIVTGSNSGTGFWCAAALAKKGAKVVLACRSPEKGEAAKADIVAMHPGASVEFIALDNMDLGSVRRFADTFKRRFSRLDVLINNAGIMAQPEQASADGFDIQFQTNHLAHFLLTDLLFDLLASSGTEGSPARVVHHSSLCHWVGHPKFNKNKMSVPDTGCAQCFVWRIVFPSLGYPVDPWKRYHMTKLCNILFGLELQRRIEQAGLQTRVESVMAHPGYASTQLQKVAADAGSMQGWAKMNADSAQSAADGALPILMAATSKSVAGGMFVGPGSWDYCKGPPVITSIGGYGRDKKMAKELWSYSEECCKQGFPVKACQ